MSGRFPNTTGPDNHELFMELGPPSKQSSLAAPAQTIMKTQAQDFTRYHDLRREMQSMIRSGKIHYLTFDDLFAEFVEITNRNGGMPPVPTDIDAAEMEMCEQANMEGNR